MKSARSQMKEVSAAWGGKWQFSLDNLSLLFMADVLGGSKGICTEKVTRKEKIW